MLKDKVSKIEFHITYSQLNDFILRAAKLIEEGYSVEKIETDTISFLTEIEPKPSIHITLQKGWNK